MPMPSSSAWWGLSEIQLDIIADDCSRIGLFEALQDAHERRLAGSVLADHCTDFAGRDRKGNVDVGLDRAVTLADAPRADRYRWRAVRVPRVRFQGSHVKAWPDRFPGPATDAHLKKSG